MEKYKKWIIRGVNNTSVKCQVCPIPRINIEISNQSGESPSTVSSAATHFKKLDSFFVLEAVSDTEIKWTLQHFFFLIYHFVPAMTFLHFWLCSQRVVLLKSFVWKKIKVHHNNYSIALYFWLTLVNKVQTVEFYTISIDESLKLVI